MHFADCHIVWTAKCERIEVFVRVFRYTIAIALQI